jgi:hypothetical protein
MEKRKYWSTENHIFAPCFVLMSNVVSHVKEEEIYGV